MAIEDDKLYGLTGEQVKDLASRVQDNQTIFYANSSETGQNRHIYKKSNMTEPASAQDILDANDKGQVILRLSTAAYPENFNDAYLQNTYVGGADYQFLFLDENSYKNYDATAATDTQFYYYDSELQFKLTFDNTPTAGSNNPVTSAGIKTSVDAAALTFKPFPASVNTTGTTQQFMNSIIALNPQTGMAYMGTVSLSDLPASLVQEEVEVYIYGSSTLYCILRSADTSPYLWWCSSYDYQGWLPVGAGDPVYNATITLTNNNYVVDSFTVNASANKTINLSYPIITMTTTDPGEGSPLAANRFVAVYNAS